MPPCRARRNPTGGEVQNSPGTLRTSLLLVISASPGRGWVGRSAPPRQARISKKLPAYRGGHPIYTPLARRAPSTARFPLDARLCRSSPDVAVTLVPYMMAVDQLCRSATVAARESSEIH